MLNLNAISLWKKAAAPHHVKQSSVFSTACCIDWWTEAPTLPFSTSRLQQELCSFHSLNIIQVLMIKVGWNSMN